MLGLTVNHVSCVLVHVPGGACEKAFEGFAYFSQVSTSSCGMVAVPPRGSEASA